MTAPIQVDVDNLMPTFSGWSAVALRNPRSCMSGQKKTVLLVEDDDTLRQTLGEVIFDEGFAVEAATDGQDALDWLNAAEILPDVVVTDLIMPRLDGWQLCDALTQNSAWCRIPILVLSSALHDRDWPRGAEPLHQMRKPPDLEHLLNLLHCLAAPDSVSSDRFGHAE